MDRKAELHSCYAEFPFERHPLWRSVFEGDLTRDQVFQAEVQHWIRTRRGQPLRKAAVDQAALMSPRIHRALNDTYIDECTDEGTENHLSLIQRLLEEGGVTVDHLLLARATPGNSAAMAIYSDIGGRGFGCHLIGAGVVEHYYSLICPKIFAAYTTLYRMSSRQAATYELHGPMDHTHAERAFNVLDEIVELDGWESVLRSVRDAFIATSLHYDGMLQAATGRNDYWNGRD